MTTTFQSLTELVSKATICISCSLSETRTKVVIADGNPLATLMLIGEGPGEQEDLSGKPFVGRAGQLLNTMLEAANIDRQTETYICNIVKCRPPQNRAPFPKEIEACRPYLEGQIMLIRPKIIVLLGATAVAGVLRQKNPKITQLHGRWLEGSGPVLEGSWILPFYHPSYLLRQHSKAEDAPRGQASQAMKEVRAKLSALSPTI